MINPRVVLTKTALYLYRTFALITLYGVLAGVMSYLVLLGFFAVSSSWVAPFIIASTDTQVLDLTGKIVQSQQNIENLFVDLNKWNKNLEAMKDSQKQLLLGDVYKDNWTFANHGVEPGDEIFLMRTGKPRAPGLIGHGFATSEIYTTTHWLYPEKEDDYADVEFDVFNLIGPPVVPLATLKTLPAQKTWTPNGSGIEIRAAAATTLRWLWANATQS